MKIYNIILVLLLSLVMLCSCTRKEFFVSDCNNKRIPPYDATDEKWKQLNEKIIQEYRACIAKPKIQNGANGVIIYRSLPKHRQKIENMICEYWSSN